MKTLLKNKFVLLFSALTICVILSIAATFDYNILTIGDGGTTTFKALCVKQGNALGARPCLRWNPAGSLWEVSNNGTLYSAIGSGTNYYVHSGNNDTTHNIHGAGEYVVLASSTAGISTINLPQPSAVSGRSILVRRGGLEAYDNRRVVINAPAGVTIVGASPDIDLWRHGSHVEFYSNGTQYTLISYNQKFGGYISKANRVSTLSDVVTNNYYIYSDIIRDANHRINSLSGRITIARKYGSIANNYIALSNNDVLACSFTSNVTPNNNCSNGSQVLGLSINKIQIGGAYKICVGGLDMEWASDSTSGSSNQSGVVARAFIYHQFGTTNSISSETNFFFLGTTTESPYDSGTASGCQVIEFTAGSTDLKIYPGIDFDDSDVVRGFRSNAWISIESAFD